MTAQHSRDLRQIGSPCCYLTVIFPALRSGLPQRTLSACRGLPPIPGSPLYLHPPPYDPGGKGQRGRGDVCPRRAGPASAPRCSGHSQHFRYRNGAAEQSAADVFPPCKPLLPQWALFNAVSGCGRREGTGLPGVPWLAPFRCCPCPKAEGGLAG